MLVSVKYFLQKPIVFVPFIFLSFSLALFRSLKRRVAFHDLYIDLKLYDVFQALLTRLSVIKKQFKLQFRNGAEL
jgi:hypothetical protein